MQKAAEVFRRSVKACELVPQDFEFDDLLLSSPAAKMQRQHMMSPNAAAACQFSDTMLAASRQIQPSDHNSAIEEVAEQQPAAGEARTTTPVLCDMHQLDRFAFSPHRPRLSSRISLSKASADTEQQVDSVSL